jgi:6-pyruvoyltetrahydropterin/6-carboxytetrahydropterin synthase
MLIATIAKRFTLDAAHRLENLPADHKCNRLHGHTYEVELEFSGPVKESGPERGFLLDYQVIADAWAPINELLDHHYLNDVLTDPTTEHLALWIAWRLAEHPPFLIGVSVDSDGAATFHRAGEAMAAPAVVDPATLLVAVTVRESSTTWCRVKVDDIRGHMVGINRHGCKSAISYL